jgi:hypothetical protein
MVKQQLRDFEAQLHKKENQFQVSTCAVSKHIQTIARSKYKPRVSSGQHVRIGRAQRGNFQSNGRSVGQDQRTARQLPGLAVRPSIE